MTKSKLKVAVLMGGPSSEHDLSLKTGKHVIHHLDEKKYRAFPITITPKGHWPITPKELRDYCDIAFIAIHDAYGEGDTIQSSLDEVKLPYTGSGTLASSLARNRFLSARLLQDAGLTIPQTLHFGENEWRDAPSAVLHRIKSYLEPPWVIKPNLSQLNAEIKMVENFDDLSFALTNAFNASREIVIQPQIKGREISCSVLDHGFPRSAYALMPVETFTLAEGSKNISAAKLPYPWLKLLQRIALLTHHLLGCRGVSRTNIMLSKGKLYVMGMDTLPDLSETSHLLAAAKNYGLSFKSLLDRIIQAAFHR